MAEEGNISAGTSGLSSFMAIRMECDAVASRDGCRMNSFARCPSCKDIFNIPVAETESPPVDTLGADLTEEHA